MKREKKACNDVCTSLETKEINEEHLRFLFTNAAHIWRLGQKGLNAGIKAAFWESQKLRFQRGERKS